MTLLSFGMYSSLDTDCMLLERCGESFLLSLAFAPFLFVVDLSFRLCCVFFCVFRFRLPFSLSFPVVAGFPSSSSSLSTGFGSHASRYSCWPSLHQWWNQNAGVHPL